MKWNSNVVGQLPSHTQDDAIGSFQFINVHHSLVSKLKMERETTHYLLQVFSHPRVHVHVLYKMPVNNFPIALLLLLLLLLLFTYLIRYFIKVQPVTLIIVRTDCFRIVVDHDGFHSQLEIGNRNKNNKQLTL